MITVLDTDPATPAWTFGTDRTVRFWQRRQVHEVTLHLYDALLSQGLEAGWTPDPELAWDGVDEVATTTSIGEGEPVELTGTRPICC